MIQFDLTFDKFNELLNHLIDNNYIKVDKNGVIRKKPCGEILSPLSFFLFDDDLKSKELERYFHHKTDKINNTFAMMEFYLLYKKSHNGQEPFNLMEFLDDYVEVGARYGWRGNPFNIVTYKKIQGNTIKIKTIYCNTNAGGFRLYKENTDIFDFNDSDYKQFETNASKLSSTLEYKEFQLPFSQPEMIKEMEKELETQQKILETLKKVYEK